MKQSVFFGRKDYLNLLTKRCNDFALGYRQNLAFVGEELIGKTSIIMRFLDTYCNNCIIAVYLEVRPESLHLFAKRFIGTLLYNFLINSALPLKEDLDFLMKEAERYAPRTVEKIRCILEALEKKKRNHIFTELLSLPELIFEETGKRCVIIFDEFLQLERLGIQQLYREWSKLLLVQKNTMYVITSSLKFQTRITLSKNLSLLFGNFELVSVEPFDIGTSETYLDATSGSLRLSKGVKDFIVHFTGGHPFYLEVIVNALLESKEESLCDILENLLFKPCGILNQRFSNYLKRFLDSSHGNDYLTILYLVASGSNRLKDIAHLARKPKKELLARINHLFECDTLSRSGDFLKMNDRVFGFWLKFVYQERTHSLTFDAKNQRAEFREKIEAMLEEFLKHSQTPPIERLKELLRLFSDDTIQIEKKKLRLSHFREVKPLEFACQNFKDGLICRSQESLWILAWKQDCLSEEDIAAFAKECKKFRHKLQRKVVVSAQEIEPNARLRALEEKIWMWDINNLNQIMDIFSKPRIIL